MNSVQHDVKHEGNETNLKMSTNLAELLRNTTNLRVLRQLMTPDVTYVSSNFDNPKLKKVVPWTGTHKGPQTPSEVFAAIQRFWKTLDFKVTDKIHMPWRAGCSSIWGVRYARGMWFTARMLEKGTSRL